MKSSAAGATSLGWLVSAIQRRSRRFDLRIQITQPTSRPWPRAPLARADRRTHLGSQTLTSVPGRRRQCWLGAAAASPAAALLAGRCASSCRDGGVEGHASARDSAVRARPEQQP